MKIPKAYLIGALATLLAGGLVWRTVFPQFSVLDAVSVFFLGFSALWTAIAIFLGILDPEISIGFRLVYSAIFVGMFLNFLAQALTDFEDGTFVNLLSLFVLYFVQHLERRRKDCD